MQHEHALALTADIAVSTMQHMAEEAGVPVEDVLEAILEGGPAKARFDAFMAVAVGELAKTR
ncbi:MAG TPA: hypothetical protein VEB64_04855 [Azospirillaceae bacterium]|nr:hypothetical protein [Azospirillaceae bacterium]